MYPLSIRKNSLYQFFLKGRDPISSMTHFIGAVCSVGLTLLMLCVGIFIRHLPVVTNLSLLVFGLSLIALYSASAYYHFLQTTPEREARFRKVDHAMIYVLIAGTYTPLCLYFMPEGHGLAFISIMWAIALIGIVVKIFWMSAPRWFSTAIYLLMGWAIIFDLKAFQGVPMACLTLIALGGIAYSVGAVMYIFKKPNLFKMLGFHELFHLFILLGSFLHFLAIFIFIV